MGYRFDEMSYLPEASIPSRNLPGHSIYTSVKSTEIQTRAAARTSAETAPSNFRRSTSVSRAPFLFDPPWGLHVAPNAF